MVQILPLTDDLFLLSYERYLMFFLSGDKHIATIQIFNSTSRYLNDYSNIDNPYFEGTVNQIYPPEVQLNKANASDTDAPFYGCTFVYFKKGL